MNEHFLQNKLRNVLFSKLPQHNRLGRRRKKKILRKAFLASARQNLCYAPSLRPWFRPLSDSSSFPFSSPHRFPFPAFSNKGLPLPLERGVCETKSKNGRSRPRKPFISRISVLRGGLRPYALRAQRLKNVKILKFSSEISNFKRATHQTPIFCGNSEGQDWNFQARLKISSEIDFFQSLGP